MKQKSGNLLISSIIAFGALTFFIWRGSSSEESSGFDVNQPPAVAKTSTGTLPPKALPTGHSPNSMPTPNGDNSKFNDAISEAHKNRKIPPGLPEDLKRQLMAEPPPLPPDIAAQIAAPPPPIPPEMQAQLAAPPPPLPPDLAAQLESPPPELPEDMQRALQTPPRVVTADEVNDPNFVP